MHSELPSNNLLTLALRVLAVTPDRAASCSARPAGHSARFSPRLLTWATFCQGPVDRSDRRLGNRLGEQEVPTAANCGPEAHGSGSPQNENAALRPVPRHEVGPEDLIGRTNGGKRHGIGRQLPPVQPRPFGHLGHDGRRASAQEHHHDERLLMLKIVDVQAAQPSHRQHMGGSSCEEEACVARRGCHGSRSTDTRNGCRGTDCRATTGHRRKESAFQLLQQDSIVDVRILPTKALNPHGYKLFGLSQCRVESLHQRSASVFRASLFLRIRQGTSPPF
ncbi:Uncharacterised protein [Kocuria rosea]|nr:Uncharacterised protein [Kocuria rosea]